MTKESKNLLLLSGGILALLVIFYWPFLCGQGSFFLSDATFWLEPQARYLRESIWSGRFPLWNPWNYCGMPQIAIPFPSLFYLPDWLFVLFPFNPALALSMIFHQMLAFVGMYLMLRHLKMSEWGSASGAIIYSLSGYMFGLSNNHSLVAGAAWFAIFFLTTSNLVHCNSEHEGFKRAIAMCLSFVFLIASGRPEVFVPSIFISLVSAICIIFERRKQGLLSSMNILWFARGLFLGIVFALPVLLPMGEWLSSSRRALGLSSYEIFLYSANWYDLLSTIIGPCLGDTRLHGNPFRVLVSYANLPAYIACVYVGPFAFILGLLGLFDKTWKTKYKLAVILLFCSFVLLALGETTPFSGMLLKICPIASFIRFPIKLLFVPVWCLSICAARGIDTLSHRFAPNIVPVLFSCFILMTGSLLLWVSQNGKLLYTFRYPCELGTMIEAQAIIATTLMLVGLVCLGYAFLLFLLKDSPKSRMLLSVSVLSITLVMNAFRSERIFAPEDHFNKPSFVANKINEFENSSTPSVRTLNLTYERFTVPELFQSPNFLERTIGELQYHRQILRPNTNVDFNIGEAFGFEGSMNGEYFNVLFNSYFKSNQTIRPEINPTTNTPLLRFASITSARYLITQIERINKKREAVQTFSDTELEKIVEDKAFNLRIYKNLKALPRCFVTYNWLSENSHNKVLESLSNQDSVWCPWQEPIIEGINFSKKTAKPFQEAKILYDSPERILIETNADSEALLILSDRIYPGWKASLDGSAVKILTANAFFRAIKIPEGKHRVEFIYQPESLFLGLGLASLGFLLLLHLGMRYPAQINSIKSNTIIDEKI